MKKLLFIVLAVLCLHVHADDYKILQMNTTSIQIGKSTCKQCDTFSDNDQIVWSADNQAIKAMNLNTKQNKQSETMKPNPMDISQPLPLAGL